MLPLGINDFRSPCNLSELEELCHINTCTWKRCYRNNTNDLEKVDRYALQQHGSNIDNV